MMENPVDKTKCKNTWGAIPAKAGIQVPIRDLDSRMRGND